MTHLSENTQSVTPIIVIDGVFFQFNNTGIARVWRCLLQQWSQSDFASHLIILDRNQTVPRFPRLTYRSIDPYDYRYCVEDSQKLQAICDQVKATVFISTYYTTPLTTPSVFMAYDFVPEVLNFDLNYPTWREKQQAILYCDHFIAISENTKQDLLRLFPFVAPETVTVAYCGVDPCFTPANTAEIKSFLDKYAINCPYVLFVGSRLGIEGYKNATLLFQALSQLDPLDPLSVVCVGGNSTLEPELAQLVPENRVKLLQLKDDELRIAYSAAIALVYSSRYEGFGLPLVEAMACECPIITCRNSSIPEVVGDAAIYVPENCPEEILSAIKQLQNPDISQKILQNGKQQVQQFSWEKMAIQVAEVLQKVDRENLQKRLIWRDLRLKQREILDKDAQIQQLKTNLLNSAVLESPASTPQKLNIKLLLSVILGTIMVILLLLANHQGLLKTVLYISPFTWEIGLVALGLISGIFGYYEIIPAKPLRWFRLLCLMGGLGLTVLKTIK